MKRTSIWLFLFWLAMAGTTSPVLAKQKARISDLTLLVDEESVGVSFYVEGIFSPKIEKAIQNGVPATFSFVIRLSRNRALWKDKRLALLKLTRRIHYDNIKKLYQVFLEETSPPAVFKHFWEAKEKLVRVENVKMVPRRPFNDQATYYVSVRAELEPDGLPFRLENLLFFASSGKIQTDWLVQKFRVGSFVLPKQRGIGR
jgi:hypothetical protein